MRWRCAIHSRTSTRCRGRAVCVRRSVSCRPWCIAADLLSTKKTSDKSEQPSHKPTSHLSISFDAGLFFHYRFLGSRQVGLNYASKSCKHWRRLQFPILWLLSPANSMIHLPVAIPYLKNSCHVQPSTHPSIQHFLGFSCVYIPQQTIHLCCLSNHLECIVSTCFMSAKHILLVYNFNSEFINKKFSAGLLLWRL